MKTVRMPIEGISKIMMSVYRESDCAMHKKLFRLEEIIMGRGLQRGKNIHGQEVQLVTLLQPEIDWLRTAYENVI